MRNYFWAVCLLIFASCSTGQKPAKTLAASQLVTDGKLWSSLFHQKAAEYNALCYQAYNIAKQRVDEAVAIGSNKPLAVITDIDETVLDNSPYAVHSALQGKDYESATWYQWTEKESATPLPGSLDFFNYAASKNVTVFYITNRDEKERKSTLNNLKKYNYPFADNEHLFLRQTSSSKEGRRQSVADNYNIVLLIGDNLSDFSTLWDKKSTTERNNNVDNAAALFGKKFIMLPNINYGGWEDAVYGNQYNLTPAQKDSAIKANLRGY